MVPCTCNHEIRTYPHTQCINGHYILPTASVVRSRLAEEMLNCEKRMESNLDTLSLILMYKRSLLTLRRGTNSRGYPLSLSCQWL